MNELRGIERRMRIGEAINLALVALCFSISLALLFKEDDQLYRLSWALGVVIPVILIWSICLFIEKKLLRYLLTSVVFAAAIFVTRKDYHFVYYLMTCLPISISGLFLPRSKGRLILTIPNVISLLVPFIPYGIGVVAHVLLLCRIAIVISALNTLNYFLYMNQSRLLTDIRMSIRTEVSVTSLVRQNRRVVAIFIIIGVVILAAVPFILSMREPNVEELVEVEYEELPTPEPTLTTAEPKDYMNLPGAEEVNLDFVPMTVGFLLLSGIIVAAVGLVLFLIYVIGGIEGKKKHAPPEIDDTMTVEKLDPGSLAKEKEHLTGYEKKIRRRYEKLIRSRTAKGAALCALTPTELEREADIEGEGADAIHEIYRKTRYSPEPATREGYAAFKEALRILPKPAQQEAGNSRNK